MTSHPLPNAGDASPEEARVKILLVDDSMTVRLLYTHLLADAGHQVVAAGSLEEGFRLALAERPQLAIVDYHMPDGNGDELARRILSHAATSSILVTILSNRTDIMEETLESGAVDLLYKDDPHPLFLLRVRAWTRHILAQRRQQQAEMAIHQQAIATQLQQIKLERMQEARDHAEHANRLKSQFLAIMSHEIRTPLNAILGMGELLRETNLDEDQARYVEISSNAGENLLALINNILDLSKIESGRMELFNNPFDLVREAHRAFDIVQTEAHHKGLRLIFYLAPGTPSQVIGDRSRIRQILINLLGNAVKFTRRGSVSLVIHARPGKSDRERAFHFSVHDTGIGIPASHHQDLFTEFKQGGHHINREFGGTGLGLSISRKLAHAMGGEITFTSAADRGSTFSLILPLSLGTTATTPLPKGDPLLRDQQTEPAASAPYNGEGKKILLAEDSEDNVFLFKKFLKSSPYKLDVVENGQQAVNAVQADRYDLILMDIQMPEMNGLTATRTIRQWERSHNIAPVPILALSANAMKEDCLLSKEAGCNCHLTKPIRKALLLAAIEDHLGGTEEDSW
ncbi:MAG: response regulator [Magnetococcales bacterium]|nr:response regulator [Magnetococcales bacterium]